MNFTSTLWYKDKGGDVIFNKKLVKEIEECVNECLEILF